MDISGWGCLLSGFSSGQVDQCLMKIMDVVVEDFSLLEISTLECYCLDIGDVVDWGYLPLMKSLGFAELECDPTDRDDDSVWEFSDRCLLGYYAEGYYCLNLVKILEISVHYFYWMGINVGVACSSLVPDREYYQMHIGDSAEA